MPNAFLLRRVDEQIALLKALPGELRERVAARMTHLRAEDLATVDELVVTEVDAAIERLTVFRRKVECP